MATTSKYYVVKFDTPTFSARQLQLLHKIAAGFLSPVHDRCYQKDGKLAEPHYKAALVFKEPISNRECKHLLASNMRYKVSSVRTSQKLDEATKTICRISHPQDYKDKLYDKDSLQWFGNKKDKPDYRLWFPYKVYTKNGLKKERGWTDKCLHYLPEPTDEKQNYYYQSQVSPAWNQYVIQKLELQEPIKSILQKKNDPAYKERQRKTAEQAERTRRQHILADGQEYATALHKALKEKTAGLSLEAKQIASILQTVKILNHIAKTLANNSFDQTPTSHSWLMEQLKDKYTTTEIYEIKNQVERVLLNEYPELVKLEAYIPENSDKLWISLCSKHREELRWGYNSVLDYFWSNPSHIMSCPRCQVDISNLYYACYNFSINLGAGLVFDFHCPYPVGKQYFGPIRKLPQVDQMPNESSPFIFGHVASEGEVRYAAWEDLMVPIRDWLKKFDVKKYKFYPDVNETGDTKQIINEIIQSKKAEQQKQKK